MNKVIIRGIILLLVIILLVSVGWLINESLVKKKIIEEKEKEVVEVEKIEEKEKVEPFYPISEEQKIFTFEDWKVYKSEDFAGPFEIKYFPLWRLRETYSKASEERKEKIIIIDYFPPGYSSVHEAYKAGVEKVSMGVTYSSIKTALYRFTEGQIEKAREESPEKLFSLAGLEFLRRIENEIIHLESCLETSKGYYFFGAGIYDPLNKGYEEIVKQIFSTFKIE